MSLVITIFIYSCLIFIQNQVFATTNNSNISDKNYELDNKENIICEIINEEDEENKDYEENKIENIWQIEIPEIDLCANIAEGTEKDILNEFVGHFKNTNDWNGNVGLAAHNRGYPVNYFSNIKDLNYGDRIIYKTNFGTRIYEVDTITIISDKDWSYLNKTNENRITLITCVENEPNFRRCIQGREIKEDI